MMGRLLLILLCLTGCHRVPSIAPDDALLQLASSPPLIVLEPETKKLTPPEILANAVNKATWQLPEANFQQATIFYTYIPGSIYRIYTSPQRITMLTFAAKEELLTPPQSGDTIRWQINLIKGNIQQHLLIKPLRANLTNNMVIVTKDRTYLLELISLSDNYMPEVAWHYPIATNLTSSNQALNFNYQIINQQGNPPWRPTVVFDDGSKTFIQFAPNIKQQELPALFIKTKEGAKQLVNYYYSEYSFIVDRLFDQAELSLGLDKVEVVLIKRRSK